MASKRLLIFWLFLGALFILPPAYLLRRASDDDATRHNQDLRTLSRPPVERSRPAVIDFGSSIGKGGEVRRLDPAGPIVSVSLSPDGHTLAAGMQNAPIEFWDLRTGKRSAASGFVTYLNSPPAFSPRGDFAVGVCGNCLYQWDLSSSSLCRNIYSNYSTFNCVTVAPNGQTAAAGGYDGSVCVFNLNMSQVLGRLSATHYQVNAVSYSPDGRQLLAAYSNGTVVVWNALTGDAQRQFQTYGGHRAIFSPDGKYVAIAGVDPKLRLYDIEREKLLHEMIGGGTAIAFSPDGSRIVGAHRTELVLWDTISGAKLATVKTDQVPTAGIAVLPDNRHVVSAGAKILVIRMAGER